MPKKLIKNCKAVKKDKKLKEGYLGQTLQDFLDVCIDEYIIDKIYVYGTDDIVYEGPMDDLPEDMRDAEFLEFEAYSNGRDMVTINVDSTEEYGLDTYYTTLEDFLYDCNNENIVVFDLGAEEEIFRGDKYDIPDEVKELIFVSFDAPNELSVNLSDYEGDSDDYDEDEDDDFEEALKENEQPFYRVVKNPKGKGYCILKRVNKWNKSNTFINDHSKEVFNTPEEAKAILDNVDELHFYIDDDFDESLKEAKTPRYFYRVYMGNRDKDFNVKKEYADEIEMLKDAKKDFELAKTEMRTDPKQVRCSLYQFIDGDWDWYMDVNDPKELDNYIDTLTSEQAKKVAIKEGFDSRVEERPINTLQLMMDNSHLGDITTVYEDGDAQVYVNSKMPKKFLNKDGSVKAENGIMLYDEEEKKIIANTPQEVYDYLDGCLIFDEMNCTKEQLEQVFNYFKGFGVAVDEDYLNQFDDNLQESTIPVKDLLVKTDNKYGITLDHAIDDIKRSKGYNDSLLGDNYTIDLLMRRFGLEHRDVIRALNYKFDGKVLDESVEDDMEKLPHVVMAFKDGGVHRLELEWRPSTKKAHSDYVDLSQAIKNKFGDADIKVKKQEWRDGNKETRYVLEVTLKDNGIKEDVNQLAKKMGAKLLPPKGYGAKPKRPRYVYEVYYFDTEDCKGDAIYRKFSSRKAQEQWYEAHKNDPDKFGMYAYEEATIYEGLDEAYNTEDRIKELKEIKKTRALTDDELEELAYCENEVSSREAEKNYLNGESLSNKLTEAPDDMGFETDDEIEAQERAEFEKRLAQRKANRDASKKQELDRQEQEKAKEQAKQDAIAKGKELYNKVKDLPFEEWFEYLVPSSGKASTVAGEIVRAVNKLTYRWYNDGDEFYQGYGRETCGAPAVYLMYKIDEVAPKLNNLINCDEDSYSKGLDELKDIVHTYLLNNQDAFGTVNEEDSMDKEEFNIDVEFEEPRDCEWQIELRDYEKDGITLADYINNGNIDAWDFISRLQEDVSSELGGNSAFEIELPWSSYATDYKIYNLTKDEWDTVSYQLSKSDYFDNYLDELYNEYGDPTEAPIDDEEVEESINRNWDTLEFNYEKLPVSKFNPNTLERTPMEIDYAHKVKQEDVEDALFKILEDKGELDDYSLEGGVAYVMNNFDELVAKYEDELKELFRSGAINTAENSDLSEDLDTFDDQMDFLSKDEEEAIDGYKKVIKKVDNAKVKTQLKKIETEEKAHKDYLTKVKRNKDIEYTEPLDEDTVKQDDKWVNKGNTGKTHGEFKTKKEADKQRKAMFVHKKPNAKWGK